MYLTYFHYSNKGLLYEPDLVLEMTILPSMNPLPLDLLDGLDYVKCWIRKLTPLIDKWMCILCVQIDILLLKWYFPSYC